MAALTATAQSALHPGPSWDETIVPTLRKRLEQESRMLSNRLSQASLGDDGYDQNFYQYSSPSASPTPSPRPSAIPRPSLSQSRPSEGSSHTTSSTRPAHFKRARTQSTPYVYDGLPAGSSPSPSPDLGRSRSPAVNGRPTRIPVSPRARSPSAASHFSSSTADANATANLTPKPNGYHMSAVDEASRSTVDIPSKQSSSGILNEQPPFATASSVTSSSLLPDQASGRSSMDSEEHPYEHWYRGDYSRNGGVGELRVGKRMEMLEIASYGHSLRKMPEKASGYVSGRTSRADSEVTMGGRTRRRAESFGARGSLYIDEDAEAQQTGMVLDEHPLTDLDGEDDFSVEGGVASSSHASHPLAEDKTHTARLQAQTSTPSRIPARRQQTEPPKTPTLNGTRNTAGTSTLASSSTTQLNTPRTRPSPSASPTSTRQRTVSATTPNAKRRAKSPATSTPTSSAKKPKTKTPPRNLRQDDKRGSIAEYPIPKDGDDDMADAIPVWTQPKAKGNWDEVVLPVVARKKGLHGLYEEADGNTPQRKPEEQEPAPAPGTFGFDYSKYKPPRTDLGAEDIPMDEFGQHRDKQRQGADQGDWYGEPWPGHDREDDRPLPTTTHVNLDEDLERERAQMRLNPPRHSESPVPFARYHSPNPDAVSANGNIPQMQVSAEVQNEKRRRQQEEEDEAKGGCCKCVIM